MKCRACGYFWGHHYPGCPEKPTVIASTETAEGSSDE